MAARVQLIQRRLIEEINSCQAETGSMGVVKTVGTMHIVASR